MPRHHLALFFLMIGAFFIGCEPPLNEEEDFEPESFFFQPVARGFNATIEEPTELVIRSEEEWAEIQPRLRLRQEVRAIDFSQAMLLLVAIPVEYSGYEIYMSAVERDADGLVAHYYLLEPGPDCVASAIDTVPFQVTMVRRADEPVRFVQEHSTYRCEMRGL